jgi:hypothetical protein
LNRIDCAKIHKFDARRQSLPCALVETPAGVG